MADEVTLGADATSTAAADVVPTTEPKKRRGGRPPKVATDMMGGMSVPKAPRAARKPAKTKDVISSKRAGPNVVKAAVKLDGRKSRAKPSPVPAPAPVKAIDEMAELLQLEQENQRLRKALAEKLREENADLRRRLGLN